MKKIADSKIKKIEEMASAGMKNKEIARTLKISEATVVNYMKKLRNPGTKEPGKQKRPDVCRFLEKNWHWKQREDYRKEKQHGRKIHIL